MFKKIIAFKNNFKEFSMKKNYNRSRSRRGLVGSFYLARREGLNSNLRVDIFNKTKYEKYSPVTSSQQISGKIMYKNYTPLMYKN